MRYTLEELQEAVNHSVSLRQVLIRLGKVPAGGNYELLKKHIKANNIDCSHFHGQAWNRGLKNNYRLRPLDEILVHKQLEHSWRLKKRLIDAGIKTHKCENCNLTEWFDSPISLELHHIDGDRTNHLINNLLLLCPNCHAMTSNYRGKNKQ